MKQTDIFDFVSDRIRTPLTALGLKLQALDLAGVEPETVRAALRDHAELTRRVTTLLSMLREDGALRRQKDRTPRVLMADHNPMLLKTYGGYLTARGLRVHTVTDGDMAVKAARTLDCDCAVLDVQAPGRDPQVDGREICKALRAFTDIPIIFLSCTLSRWEAGVDGLMGARDAYLEKPCDCETLYGRILYCLGQAREPPTQESDFFMDWEAGKLRWKERTATLSPREAAMLRLLTERPGQDVTVAELRAVWPGEPPDEVEMMRTILNLQRKTAFAGPRLGKVSRRRGGKLRLEPPEVP